MSEVQQHTPNTPVALSMTPSAVEHVRKQLKARGHGIGLRLSLKPAGCAKFTYVLDFIDETHAEDHIYSIAEGIVLAVDKTSLPHLQGTELDFVTEGLQSHFVYRNPNAEGTCGCGESFS